MQLIDNIYQESKNMPEKEIFVKIKRYLSFISSSDKSKYYYIYKMDGTCISVPANRKLEGKNLIDLRDIKGQYVVRTMIDIASKGGGFNEWYYLNPKSKKIEKKIGYVIVYKPLNIFIGTAIYEQDIIKNIKEFSSHLLCDFKTSYGGYIFAYDDKGNTISHIKKDLIGTNRWNLKKNGRYLLQELIKKGQEKNGNFLEYEATINPKTKKPANKISFLNEFKKLKWVIGTGFYTDELYNDIKTSQEKLKKEFEKELKNIIISAIVFTLILVGILWFILNNVSRKLIRYRKELENNNKELNGLNINLEDKVREKTKDLDIKNRELQQYLDVIDDIEIGIFIVDEDFKVRFMNNTMIKWFGDQTNTICYKSVAGIADPCPYCKIKDVIKSSKKVRYTPSTPDGQFFDIVSAPIHNTDGTISKMEVIRNVTEQKRLEEQLFKSEKLASMGDMIGNIAHQWRQPLSVITTASSGMQLQKEYGILTDKLFQESCNAINKNAQYLSNTIDDFKNFIKDDRAKAVFSLKDDIDSFLNLVEGSIKRHNINIILDLQEDIKIDGYENELNQCFINIFNNAKDVLKENVEDNRLIFISTSSSEDKVIIKIKDNGGGIPKDILPKIFEPYFTTKHQSQGTGLGLHMTYNLIVDGMNGTIEVTNETYTYQNKEYTGAVFIIKLPLK